MKSMRVLLLLLLSSLYSNAQLSKEAVTDSLFNTTGVFDIIVKLTPTFIDEFESRIPIDSMKSAGRKDFEKVILTIKNKLYADSHKTFLSKFSEADFAKISEAVNSGTLAIFDKNKIGELYSTGQLSEDKLKAFEKFISSELSHTLTKTLREIKQQSENKLMEGLMENMQQLSDKYGVK